MYHRENEVQSSSKQSLNIKKLEITKSEYYNTQFWILHNSHDKCLSSRLYHHVWHTHMCDNHKSLTCSKLNSMTSYAKIKLPTMTNYNTQIVEKRFLNVECLCYVYEIKHKRLSDIYIVWSTYLKICVKDLQSSNPCTSLIHGHCSRRWATQRNILMSQVCKASIRPLQLNNV
jgi:hypothetical protein